MQEIGYRIPDRDEAFRWDTLSSNEGTECFYDERTGMEYEYAHDLGILAANHDAVGLVTYYRCSEVEFDALLDEATEIV